MREGGREGEREGGREGGRKGKKRKKGGRLGVGREGWEGTLLKTTVDYQKRQSGKSVMTSVSQPLH